MHFAHVIQSRKVRAWVVLIALAILVILIAGAVEQPSIQGSVQIASVISARQREVVQKSAWGKRCAVES